MRHILQSQLQAMLEPDLFLDNKQYDEFKSLVVKGKLVKGDNPQDHCCVFFIPYNPKTKEILIVDHKKAKQWVVPGGHVEKGELLEDAARREAKEELGMEVYHIDKPFLFSVMRIHNDGQSCLAHYDVWFLVPLEKELHIDFTEFNDARWVSVIDAKKFITHPIYLQALEKMQYL